MPEMHAESDCNSPPAVRDRIREIAADIFQLDIKCIKLDMGPDDVDRWDSMNHLRLITEVESTFSIHLSMPQIQKIVSLEDLAAFVSERAP